MATTLYSRLKEVRGTTSTRAFAHLLAEKGAYHVTHAMIARYEKGTTPPADYIGAVCMTCDVRPSWLLLGVGPRHWARAEERHREMLAAAAFLREIAFSLEKVALAGGEPLEPRHVGERLLGSLEERRTEQLDELETATGLRARGPAVKGRRAGARKGAEGRERKGRKKGRSK